MGAIVDTQQMHTAYTSCMSLKTSQDRRNKCLKSPATHQYNPSKTPLLPWKYTAIRRNRNFTTMSRLPSNVPRFADQIHFECKIDLSAKFLDHTCRFAERNPRHYVPAPHVRPLEPCLWGLHPVFPQPFQPMGSYSALSALALGPKGTSSLRLSTLGVLAMNLFPSASDLLDSLSPQGNCRWRVSTMAMR